MAWWVSPIGFAGNCSHPIREPEPTVEVWSDANLQGAGGNNSLGEIVQRKWTASQLSADHHISFLETCAAREAVHHLAEPGDKVRLHIDNSTACAYIRKQGGT